MANGDGQQPSFNWTDRIVIAVVLGLGMFLLNEIWQDIGEVQRDMSNLNRSLGESIAKGTAIEDRLEKIEREHERRWDLLEDRTDPFRPPNRFHNP